MTTGPLLPRLCRTLLAAALLAALSACGGDSADKLMASARDYIARGDDPAAVIQLRNVLQKQSDKGEARLLLGQALLRQGDVLSAEKELRRALEFGQPRAVVVPALAQSMLELGQFDAMEKEFRSERLDAPAAQASLLASLGEARLRSGRLDEAGRDFAAALALQPGQPVARLGQGRLALFEGRFDDTLAIADELLKTDPASARAQGLRADVLLSRGEVEPARQALTAALQADPRFTTARLALASLLISEKKFQEAAQQIEAGKKASRGDSRLLLLDASLSMRQGKRDEARGKVQQVLKVAPDHVPSLLLAGEIDLTDNQVASAQQHLRRALSRAPAHDGVRRTLAASYLRGGQPARAMETLQPLLAEGKRSDPGLMMLAGETFLANGDIKQATAYFSRATAGEVQKAPAQTRLGQIALASGDAEGGLRQLGEAASIEGSDHQADLALIAAHLRRSEFDKAMAAARALEKKQPQNPLAHHMLGVVSAARKDLAAARTHFDKAVELAPAYLPSLGALAGLDLADKRPEDARKRFESLIALEPKNELGYLGLADIQARTGATSREIGQTLARAVSANPQAAQARIAQVGLLLSERDNKAALSAAQAAASALPDEPRVIETLARAQEAAGEYNQAVDSLQRLVSMQPDQPRPLQELAALHARNKQFDRALDALRRAQRLAPDSVPVTVAIARAQLASGRADDALKEARALQARQPKQAAAWEIEGDIHAARKDWPAAERALREALKLDSRDATAAVRLHAALRAGGKGGEAAAHARRWLAEQPRDPVMRMHLADVALGERNLKSAFALYQEVVALAPDNPVALNNLAWTAGELGDARALGYAERAARLAPGNAAVLDTLGTLQVRSGDAAQGLRTLARARELAPERADIALNHAKAMIAAGDKEGARKLLETLKQRPESFAGKDGIDALLKSL